MSRTGEFWGWPWYKKLLSILLSPFVLLIGLFVLPLLMLVSLFVVCSNFTGEHLFYLSMWNDGRTLSRRKLRRRFDAGETGTLILESPTMGWGFTHAWWTPDDLKTLSPVIKQEDDVYWEQVLDLMEEDQPHPWDEWCWQEYVSPHQGKAFLLKVWNGKKYANWLKRHFPSVTIVETASAIARQHEFEAQQETR
ncbi:hypothetical protein [Gimesia fumaroli]|uniref:Uncharacterized protein n=1 Tax=Gimesia fumaroli TaxID=2527976 RepID=A0A518I6M9_9PLAN|nr:hypothetical protein [Gimesia fumaroli]QDV48733.1 hypothetical protein Enr17x_07460 [Gimesia fumaroli]